MNVDLSAPLDVNPPCPPWCAGHDPLRWSDLDPERGFALQHHAAKPLDRAARYGFVQDHDPELGYLGTRAGQVHAVAWCTRTDLVDMDGQVITGAFSEVRFALALASLADPTAGGVTVGACLTPAEARDLAHDLADALACARPVDREIAGCAFTVDPGPDHACDQLARHLGIPIEGRVVLTARRADTSISLALRRPTAHTYGDQLATGLRAAADLIGRDNPDSERTF